MESSVGTFVERLRHRTLTVQHGTRLDGQPAGLDITLNRRGRFQYQHFGHHHITRNAAHNLGIYSHHIAYHPTGFTNNDLALTLQTAFERTVYANIFFLYYLSYDSRLGCERIMRHPRKIIILCHNLNLVLFSEGNLPQISNLRPFSAQTERIYTHIAKIERIYQNRQFSIS